MLAAMALDCADVEANPPPTCLESAPAGEDGHN